MLLHERYLTAPALRVCWDIAGGGGSAGQISYPDYMETFHQEYLHGGVSGDPEAPVVTPDVDIASAMNDLFVDYGAITESPYKDVVGYDPEPELDKVQHVIDDAAKAIDLLDPEGHARDDVFDAADIVRQIFLDEAEVAARVDTYEARTQARHARAVSRMTAGMFDVRAVMSSQFGMGLALLEHERQQEINAFEAEIRLDGERQLRQMAIDLTRLFAEDAGQQARMRLMLTTAQMEQAKARITAGQDKINFDLQAEIKDLKWDLDLFDYANKGMAAIAGAAHAKNPSEFERNMMLASLGIQSLGALIPLFGML